MKNALKDAMKKKRGGMISITIGPENSPEVEERIEQGKVPWGEKEDGMAPGGEGIDMYKAESELDLGENKSLMNKREMERAEMLAESGEEPKSLQDKILLEKFKKMNKEG